MLYLFSDFGWQGPYVGELKAVLARSLAHEPIIDLMHDAPACNPRASAYLLAALSHQFRPGDHCLAVVDPGVGHAARRPIVLHVAGVTFVGPDNGLFAVLATRASDVRCDEIDWRPAHMSDSFHGRDLFAPVMLMEMTGRPYSKHALAVTALTAYGHAPDLDEVIYIDHYGNCITGLRGISLDTAMVIRVQGRKIPHARTFAMVGTGEIFWYVNSMGLVEIACNQGSAVQVLDVSIGTRVQTDTTAR